MLLKKNVLDLWEILIMKKYNMQTKTLLKDFTRYIHDHPKERFWQALRNWSGESFIYASNTSEIELPPEINMYCKDTFFFEEKNK